MTLHTIEEEKNQLLSPAIVEQPQSVTPFMAELLRRQQLNEPAREAVVTETDKTLNVKRTANKNFNLAIDRFQGSVDEATNLGDRALNRLDALDQNPQFFNTIMGFFDADFNRGVQTRNLSRAQLQISRAQTRLQNAQIRRQLTIGTAEAEKASVKEIFQFNRQGILDTVALIQAGFEVEQNIRKQDVQFAQDQSIKSLEKFLNNPATAPVQLKNRPGLIDAILTSKRAAKLGISAQEFNLSVSRKALAKRTFLNQFNSVEEIVNFKGELPDGVSQLDLNQRRRDFIEIEDAIETAKLAMTSKKLTLLNKQKAIILTRMGSMDVKEFLNEAVKNKGQIEIGGIPFAASELRTALVAMTEKEAKEERILAENEVSSSNIMGNLTTVDMIGKQFPSLYNPTSPDPTLEDIPVDVLSTILNQNLQIDNQKRRVQEAIDANSGTADAAIKILFDMTEKTKEFYKEQVEERVEKDFSKDAQPAAREFFLTGQIGPANAIALTIDVGGNSALFIENDILDAPWTKLTSIFPDIALEKVTTFQPGIGGEGFSAASGKQRDSVILERAVKESKFREGVATNIQLLSMAMAVNQLAEEMGAPSPVTGGPETLPVDPNLNAFAKLRDPRTGRLATRFNNDDGGFDLNKFLQFAATETLALQKAGVLQPNETVADLVFDRSRVLANIVIDKSFSGLYGTALKSAVFGNRPQNTVLQAIDAANALIPQSIKSAEANQRALSLTIDAINPLAGEPIGP